MLYYPSIIGEFGPKMLGAFPALSTDPLQGLNPSLDVQDNIQLTTKEVLLITLKYKTKPCVTLKILLG